MGQPVGAKVESSMTTPASSRASPLPQAHRQPEQRRGACRSGLAREEARTNTTNQGLCAKCPGGMIRLACK